MDAEIVKILQKCGRINNKTQKFAKKLIKPDMSLYEIGIKIDNYIIEQGGFPAWPVNLSVNHQAAHNSYSKDNSIILKEDDVLKVDVGVCIDGYIADASQTIIFSKKYEKLRECSFVALEEAKKYVAENYKTALISKVGAIVETKIKEYGYKPVSNLTGHFIGKYKTHEYPSIPNIYTDLDLKFNDYDNAFAIEPFATSGNGYVTEGPMIYIFEFVEDKAVRNKDARTILEEIKKFKGMPFSEYWVGKKLSDFCRKVALRELLKVEAISGYPVLVDKNGSHVSQWETTFIIDDGLIDTVNICELY